MQQITEEFLWSNASTEAAQLLAVGELTNEEIAERVGVHTSTLWRWRKNAAFSARVEEHLEEIRAEIRRRGIGVVERRVDAFDRLWNKLHRVIADRADDMKGVPGGSTGLLVRKFKTLGSGENAKTVEEYAVDTGLISEIRELGKQAAQELGQWVNRSNVEQTVKSYETGNSPDDL